MPNYYNLFVSKICVVYLKNSPPVHYFLAFTDVERAVVQEVDKYLIPFVSLLG